MKKILFATLFVSLFACSGSDDNPQTITPTPTPQTTHLSGRWNLSKKSINGHLQDASYCETQYNYYQFSPDGGAIFGQYHMYSIGGSNYCEQSTNEGNYAITNGILTYTYSSNYQVKYNIISANDLTIKLEMFFYHNNAGDTTIPQNERVIEICNKAQ